MLGDFFSGMHRYKRVARYADRKGMKETIKASRTARTSIDFNGDFPQADQWTPVESFPISRDYTRPSRDSGVNDVVRPDHLERRRVFSEHGVLLGPAVAMLTLLAVLLGIWWGVEFAENMNVSKRLAAQESRMESLRTEEVLIKGQIATRCSSVNVRQEALRIGMKNTRGMATKDLELPQNAVIDPDNYGLRRDTASVFGQ